MNHPKTLISQSKEKEIDKLRRSLLADSATKTDFVSVFNFKSTNNFTISTPKFVVHLDVDKQIFWRCFCDLKEPVKHRSALALANISWDLWRDDEAKNNYSICSSGFKYTHLRLPQPCII